MIIGFVFSMVSCTTDAYDVQTEDIIEKSNTSFMNKDGDVTIEDDGTIEVPENDNEGDNVDSTDPIVKPKRD
jgi:hypothetical protein